VGDERTSRLRTTTSEMVETSHNVRSAVAIREKPNMARTSLLVRFVVMLGPNVTSSTIDWHRQSWLIDTAADITHLFCGVSQRWSCLRLISAAIIDSS
jgi:hypothetical protein